MSLNERIEEDYKEALRKKSEVVVSTLRMLRAALKNFQIDTKGELTDENVIKMISSEVKKHKDSINEYKKGDREDLAQKESDELEILMKYMRWKKNLRKKIVLPLSVKWWRGWHTKSGIHSLLLKRV